MTDKLRDFVRKIYAHNKRTYIPKVILAFDPGETTGFACMYECELIGLLQIDTAPDSIRDCWDNLSRVFNHWSERADMLHAPIEVSCEDYRVYAHKTESHAWSTVHTIKIVGLIQLLTAQRCDAPIRMRMASAAKNFVTDAKLESWGIYERTVGKKHARDAVRHAIFHECFPAAEDSRDDPRPTKTSTK